MRIPQQPSNRPGAILILVTLLLIGLVSMIALAIDVGMVMLARNQSQNAADIAAMAAVRELNGDTANNNNFAQAEPTAKATAGNNGVLGQAVASTEVSVRVGYYSYDTVTQKFVANFSGTKPANENWSAVEVTINNSRPMAFARIFNVSTFTSKAMATAVHRPRDIAIILDFSGSMRFSSLNAYPYSGNKSGSLNPDPAYPKFGHWSVMQDVMFKDTSYVDGNGQVFAPSNMTVQTENGPPIVLDFLTRDSGGNLVSAFNQTNSPYDPMVWAVPAPIDFDLQVNLTLPYVGDTWPRFNRLPTGNYARTVQEYLFGNNNTQSNTHVKNVTFEPAVSTLPTLAEGYGPLFKGYSMGPGYYGKTFYVWPPDPRYHPTNAALQLDWRKKFFTYRNSSTPMDDNSKLWDSSGYWRQAGSSSSYDVNYTAVIQWIKAGPKVFPDNLRSGRVLYYNSIPDSIPSSGGTVDQRFWRGYIDYVIGSGSTSEQRQSLYGRHSSGWGSVRITAKSSLNSNSSLQPYMHYNDNPIRPRLHFWFGPLTMVDFLSRYSDNWLPGTCHESQTWQLKAGIQSALKDIEKNHPNDWVSLMYFSHLSEFSQARVSLGRDYTRLKNALWFPYSLLSVLNDPNQEIRPYQNNDSLTWNTQGVIPSATGGTAPEMALKVAYNELSGWKNGRRGAAKMIIFETDGVPNHTADGDFVNQGAYQSYYNNLGNTSSYGNNHSTVLSRALDVVTHLCNLDSHPSKPGYSTSRAPVRVHALAFGDLFQSNTSAKTDALDFLLEVQKKGYTSASNATSIESYKIITGDFNTRINNLRQAMERIMQSGIQVSLLR